MALCGRGRTPAVRASPDLSVPVICPVEVMGLKFANPLGLAAGFDRTGRLLPSLAPLGFGHIEVGTITPGTARVALATPAANRLRLGANIGSARRGLDRRVVQDYLAALSRVWERTDYIVANLSSPFLARDGNMPGVDALIGTLSETWHQLRSESGRHVPLLVKVACGARCGELPAAISAVKDHKLSGIVLVSSSLRQITAACELLESGAVISVGGVVSGADVEARLKAGAALVQMYTTFVRDGPETPRRVLADLDAVEGH